MAFDLTIPQNFNPLYNDCFHFEIRELPKVSGFAQRFNMPGLRLGKARQVTPLVDFDIPGEKIEFEELEIAFLVDENIENFMEIYHWIVYLGFPRNTEQFKQMMNGRTRFTETSDIILTTTTNKHNPNRRIHFVDAFPVNLTPVEFTNVDQTTTPLIASAMFGYKYYYFEGQDETLDGIDKGHNPQID
jgi:hypothetical protein